MLLASLSWLHFYDMDNRNEERPRGDTTRTSQIGGMVLSTKDSGSYHREKKEVPKNDEEKSGHGITLVVPPLVTCS